MKQVKDLCYEQLKTLSDEQIAEAIGNSDPSSSTDFLTNLTVKQTGSKPEGDDEGGGGGERMDGVCEEEEDKEIVITVSDVSDGLDNSSGPETEEAGSRARAEGEEGGARARAKAEEGRSRARAGGEEGGTRARAEAEEGRSRARAGGEEGGMRARAKAEEGRSRARAEEKEVGARAEAEEGKTRVGARAEARGEKEEGVSGENLAKSEPNSSVRPIATTSSTVCSSSNTETSDQPGDRQEVATMGNTEHRVIASRDEGSTSHNAGDSVEEREGAIASRELTADELLEMDLRRRALEAELRKTNAGRGKAGGSRASRQSGQDPEASQPSQSVERSESSRSSGDVVERPKSVKGPEGSRKESGVECEDLIAIHPEYRDSEEEGVEEGEGRVSRRKERRRDRRKQEGRNSRRKGREEEGHVSKSEENRRKGRGEEECGGKGVEERSKRDGEGSEGLRLEEERRGSDDLEVGRLLEERLRQRALRAMLARRAEQAAILQQQSHTDLQHMSS